jgi:histidine ammonia-lyase
MLLRPGHLSLDELQAIHAGGQPLLIDPAALPAIQASAAVVQAAAAGDAPVYGVNTGFGKLAGTRISADDLATLQRNLIRSHSVGVGEPLAAPVLRVMLATKAASLARGHSGVRPVVIDTLLAVHNAGLIPYVPSQGSVGASGDLAPLSHMVLALLGEGARRYGDAVLDGTHRWRWPAMSWRWPEGGLALLNGPGQHRAGAGRAVPASAGSALVIGALTVDARGSDGPFDPRIHALRGQPGQIDVAQYYRALLCGSSIRASHTEGDDRVQDPYSLRCQPQVVGACLDQLRHAALVLLREANAVTDNPLVFVDDGTMVSGGNFHAEPVALAADAMANAIAEVGAIAERRIAMLIDSNVSRLPPILTPNAGLNSGFMILHMSLPPHWPARTRLTPTRPASTACPPAPTRKITSAWPPLPRAGCSR